MLPEERVLFTKVPRVCVVKNNAAAAWKSKAHINMEPQVVLLADVGDLVDGVERTVHCGTGCGVHEQWHVAL